MLLPAARTGLTVDSKAQAERIERIGTRIGVVLVDVLATLDEALRLRLAL